MEKDPISQNDSPEGNPARRRLSPGRAMVALGMVVFGVFYSMLSVGAASFVHECNTLVCGQLHQALFAAVGALALGVGAYRLLMGRSSAASIVFFGTLPILIVHLFLVATDPNESVFFPLGSAPPPLLAGVVLMFGLRRDARNRHH